MSKRLFLKKFITENKQTWALLPSSGFLAKKMVKKWLLSKSKVIIELGAWSWIFTQKIFEYLWADIKNKKVFIIEKDKDFYDLLLKKFPEYKEYIFNIDLLHIEELLKSNSVDSVDLIISGLPFKSLPKEIFSFLVDIFLPKYVNNKTTFIQFSYFSNFSEILLKYFNDISIAKCILNIPSAYVFTCSDFILKDENK